MQYFFPIEFTPLYTGSPCNFTNEVAADPTRHKIVRFSLIGDVGVQEHVLI